jgi:hypothetical protein
MTVRVLQFANAADLLLAEPGTAALVTDGAAQVARNASDIIPVESGHGAASYQSTDAERQPVGLVATAYTDDVAGHMFEWGSIHNPAFAPLRRGVERAGLRGRPLPKGDS